jgi:hypothetical protein
MKKEYDFSKGIRGRFYQEGAKLNTPVYLDEDVHRFVQEIADAKKSPVSDIVNRLLKSDMHLMEAVR